MHVYSSYAKICVKINYKKRQNENVNLNNSETNNLLHTVSYPILHDIM